MTSEVDDRRKQLGGIQEWLVTPRRDWSRGDIQLSATTPVTKEYTALCAKSTHRSRVGQVDGGAPTPVVFSTVWSKASLTTVWAAFASGPRIPVTAPSEAPGNSQSTCS